MMIFLPEMKKIWCSVALLALAGACFSSCQSVIGSVSAEAVQEMLESPRLAVTPFLPAWLDEDGSTRSPLSEKEQQAVCAILRSGTAREVPELAYQTDDEHAPLVQNRFYIYGSNGQCLAGTVLNERVVMHDVVLPVEQEQALYQVLKPHLKKIFSGLK